jgi:GAF domain-containing protein
VALVNARLFDETRRRTAQLEALNAIITEVAAASDLDHLLQTTLDHTLHALGLDMGGIWVEEQTVMEKMPDQVEEFLQKLKLDVESGLGSPMVVDDWQRLDKNDPLYESSLLMNEHDLRASLTVALISGSRWIGGLSVISSRPHSWLPEEIALIEGVAKQLGGAIERITLLEQIQENARQVQHIIDTVPEGVILLDEQKRIVLANPVAQSYLIHLAAFNSQDVLTHLGKKPLAEILSPASRNSWFELESPGPGNPNPDSNAGEISNCRSAGSWHCP